MFKKGFTGGIIERELLGKSELPEAYKDIYLPYKKALEVARKMQPFDPTDPKPRFANDLHATVAEGLGIEDYGRLKFFTAVGTPLDVKHGVDAFLELKVDKQTHRVTLDVTTNPQKGDKHKADIVFFVPPDGYDLTNKEDKIAYSSKIEEVATAVIARMQISLRGN